MQMKSHTTKLHSRHNGLKHFLKSNFITFFNAKKCVLKISSYFFLLTVHRQGLSCQKTCDSLLCKYSNRNSQKTCEILDVGKFKCYSKKHLPTLCKEGSFPRLLQVAIALDVVLISRSYQVSICHFEKEDERITASVLILCRLISRIIQIVLTVSGLVIRTAY